MSTGFGVDPEQLRGHAANLESLLDRFNAVRTASGHITQADGAYGLLCNWIPGVLEERHTTQDDLVEGLAENIRMHAENMREIADAYDEADAAANDDFKALDSELSGGK